MRLTVWQKLLNAVAAGRDLAPAEVTSAEMIKQVEALNMAMRHAWHWANWPELTRTEERDLSGGLAAWAQEDLDTLGTVAAVYLDNPDTTRNPRKADWRWNANGLGVQVFGVSQSSVWIQYRPQVPEWTSTAYAADTAYVEGDVAYYATTGECYRALQSTTGNAPTSTAHWAKLEAPWIFRRAVPRGALALLAGGTGKRTEEQILEASMAGILAQELEQFRTGQHQTYSVV